VILNLNLTEQLVLLLCLRDSADGKLLNRTEPHMTESTTYNPKNELKVIVHGWLGSTQEEEGLCTYTMRGESGNVCDLPSRTQNVI